MHEKGHKAQGVSGLMREGKTAADAKAKRKQVSKSMRFKVFARDRFVCQYCGAHPPAAILHVDHLHPVSKGGKNDIDNLITACEACNLGKGSRLLSDAPKSLEERAAEVAEREEQLRGYSEILRKKAERIEDEAWEVAAALTCNPVIEKYSRANLLSIKRFLDRLPLSDVLEAAEIAVCRKRIGSDAGFKYFCGICWSKIRGGESGPR